MKNMDNFWAGGKPADVFIHAFRKGSAWAFDVAVPSPFKTCILRSAAQHQLAAAGAKAVEKYGKYGSDIADVVTSVQDSRGDGAE